MSTKIKKVIILACLLALSIPIYAQNGSEHKEEATPALKAESTQEELLDEAPTPIKVKETRPFFDFIDKKAYASAVDKGEEKKILREKWKKLLGVDIFYPYFKAKEVEDWVSDRASVRFFNLRGRPKFENNQIKYTFKLKF